MSSILIFRTGSLGDMLVALPALNTIARAHPSARRVLLTNLPLGIGNKEVSARSLFEDTDLIHEYINYSPKFSARDLFELAKHLRSRKFDRLAYLMPRRSVKQLFRDEAFFRVAGMHRMVGLNYSSDFRTYKQGLMPGNFELEAARLVRNLRGMQPVSLNDPESWSLRLSVAERAAAEAKLASWPGRSRFIVASVGTKVDVKDWGEKNWTEWAGSASAAYSNVGLVLVGSGDEFGASAHIGNHWAGPVLNLCGELTPRESACIIERAELFVGHDSGPMHLAASVGTRCVSIFSARERPGIWFPFGSRHKVLYHETDCAGCRLDTCVSQQKKCINAIKPAEVLAATVQLLH